MTTKTPKCTQMTLLCHFYVIFGPKWTLYACNTTSISITVYKGILILNIRLLWEVDVFDQNDQFLIKNHQFLIKIGPPTSLPHQCTQSQIHDKAVRLLMVVVKCR